jgi:hypothetical protein
VGAQYGHQLDKIAGQYGKAGAAMADTAASALEQDAASDAQRQADKMLGTKVRPAWQI